MKRTTQLHAAQAFAQLVTHLNAIGGQSYDPAPSGEVGLITQINASLMTQATFSEPLTTYATGWRDDGNVLQQELDFFAPSVQTSRRFEYASAVNAEQFYSETADDARAIGAAFKEVEYKSTKVNAKTGNRGLQIVVDLDEVKDKPNWEQEYVRKLMSRLKRNKLRRALALLAAAATNTAKTWDTTAGKDPDQDVLTDLIAAASASGVKPNRVGYGDTAWSKRVLSHRAQDTAGGFASAAMTPEALAAWLGVESVLKSSSRYSSSSSARTEIVANLVMMFFALQDADTEDASNIKDFWSPCDNGSRYAVHSIPHGIKRHVIAVEHHELMVITSTLGIRKFTVS